jgi:hypothetical protein
MLLHGLKAIISNSAGGYVQVFEWENILIGIKVLVSNHVIGYAQVILLLNS